MVFVGEWKDVLYVGDVVGFGKDGGFVVGDGGGGFEYFFMVIYDVVGGIFGKYY